MQKGIIFTVEAIYIVAIVFVAVILLMSSLQAIESPNYDIIQTMKVAHDYGENKSAELPDGYMNESCLPNQTTVNISYYDVEVCFQ